MSFPPRKRKKYKKREIKEEKPGRLGLDDALAQDQSTWSACRVEAYSLIHSNPNAYYFRFNAPGETQGTGPWSKKELRSFFLRYKELYGNTKIQGVGQTPRWGEFSRTVPGRVGYQCSGLYRTLIKKGKWHKVAKEALNYNSDEEEEEDNNQDKKKGKKKKKTEKKKKGGRRR
eukprot:CAMPEP_0174258746 /NCGR_PEP_ID=MMETSP0439-20130205/7689_1 /TAXON_ID=0 /ORGANISM="Stereomyxa ramosa, Strain Chinc5" /LENGTH=172 /DNA_ID=CAMNT_0015342369 /DNA_START=41 /DNA_END=556 /DNA_ORIENTATION=-